MLNGIINNILTDERDVPLLKLLIKVYLLVFPSALYILFSDFSIFTSLFYLVLIILPLMLPFATYVHTVIHRDIFSKKYSFLNHLNYWTVGLLLGETPYTHYAHHIGMHHPENNRSDDLSTTIWYKRDKFSHFILYWFHFMTSGYSLIQYFLRKKKGKMIKKVLLGEISFGVLFLILLVVNPMKAIFLLGLPFIILRALMVCTNWTQHAFLDLDDLKNNYKICATIINSSYNRACFNDAYHIEHHSRPGAHWSTLPEIFHKNREQYIANKSIIFHSLSYLQLFLLLMLKKYDLMANYFVDLSGILSKSDIIELLRMRTRSFQKKENMFSTFGLFRFNSKI